MPIHEFERSLHSMDNAARRDEKVAFIMDGISLYRDEQDWKRQCQPSFWVLCLIPLFWPFLAMRSAMSKSTQQVIAAAINSCRARWADDLADVEIDYEEISEI